MTQPAHSKDKFGPDLKVIVIGNTSTGKTSFLNRYINGSYAENYYPTISFNFNHKIIQNNNTLFRVQFWDLAGQDRNPELTNIFCQNSQGIIVLCEANNENSRKDTLKWKDSLFEKGRINPNQAMIILVENKSDLLPKGNEKADELERFAYENQFDGCFRTSAKLGEGIQDAMNYLLKGIINDKLTYEEKVGYSYRSSKKSNVISLNNSRVNESNDEDSYNDYRNELCC